MSVQASGNCGMIDESMIAAVPDIPVLSSFSSTYISDPTLLKVTLRFYVKYSLIYVYVLSKSWLLN